MSEYITMLEREVAGVWKEHVFTEKVNFVVSELLWKINN